MIRESAFEENKKKSELKCNPGLALISLGTTGPWWGEEPPYKQRLLLACVSNLC